KGDDGQGNSNDRNIIIKLTKNASPPNQSQRDNNNTIPPTESWSNDIPPHLEREYYHDQMSCPTPGSNI
ncbi:6758_t:CDS:1, partial [Funneliformis geosporum]